MPVLSYEDRRSARRDLHAARHQGAEDFFHSRLAFAPDAQHLLSAGWVWHPWSACNVYSVEHLDEPVLSIGTDEVEAAAWLDADRLLVTTDDPLEIGVWSLTAGQCVERTSLPEHAGTLMPVGDEHFVGFHEHPRLFETRTGRIVERWDSIASGTQTSSIIGYVDPPPPIALDPAGRRFAVASPTGVDVVML